MAFSTGGEDIVTVSGKSAIIGTSHMSRVSDDAKNARYVLLLIKREVKSDVVQLDKTIQNVSLTDTALPPDLGTSTMNHERSFFKQRPVSVSCPSPEWAYAQQCRNRLFRVFQMERSMD